MNNRNKLNAKTSNINGDSLSGEYVTIHQLASLLQQQAQWKDADDGCCAPNFAADAANAAPL